MMRPAYNARPLGPHGPLGPAPGLRVVGRIRITILSDGSFSMDSKLPSKRLGAKVLKAALTEIESMRESHLLGPRGEAINATGSVEGA